MLVLYNHLNAQKYMPVDSSIFLITFNCLSLIYIFPEISNAISFISSNLTPEYTNFQLSTSGVLTKFPFDKSLLDDAALFISPAI